MNLAKATIALTVLAALAAAPGRSAIAADEPLILDRVITVAALPVPSGPPPAGLVSDQPASPQWPEFQAGGNAPIVASAGQSAAAGGYAPTLDTEFSGLSNWDNSNSGLLMYAPPDPQIAVGPSHAMEMVNHVGRIYDKATLLTISTFKLADFFGVLAPRCMEGAPESCWRERGPRLLYDALSGRWMATYMSYADNPPGQTDWARLHIAVSATSDPTGTWYIYYHPYGDHFPDEPWLGVTADKITVSPNLFDIDTSAYAGQQTRVYNKAEALAGGPTVSVTVFPTRTDRFSVRPAQTMTPQSDQLAAMIQGDIVTVYRYSGPPEGVTETVIEVPVGGHSAPSAGEDPGGLIDAGDGRLMGAFVDGGSLWLATSTFCEDWQGFTTCSQIIEISTSTYTQLQNILLGSSGEHNLYPAVLTDALGNLVMRDIRVWAEVYMKVMLEGRSPDDPPGIVYTQANAVWDGEVAVGTPVIEPPTVWGYSSAARDPSGLGTCIWLVAAYPKDIAGVGRAHDWGTTIAKAVHSPFGGDCDDYDNDGSVDTIDVAACGGDPLNPAKKPERIDGAFAGVDDDGDTLVDEALPSNAATYDCDGDGYKGSAEAGTPLCGNGANDDGVVFGGSDDAVVDDGCLGGPPQAGAFSEAQFNIGLTDQDSCGLNGWPSDFVSGGIPDSTNKINLLDQTSFLAPVRRLDTSPGNPAFDDRWDLVPGRGSFPNWIAINDLTSLIAGATGFPPMLGGLKAFNGPSCPWVP